jgi:hypothetical protein
MNRPRMNRPQSRHGEATQISTQIAHQNRSLESNALARLRSSLAPPLFSPARPPSLPKKIQKEHCSDGPQTGKRERGGGIPSVARHPASNVQSVSLSCQVSVHLAIYRIPLQKLAFNQRLDPFLYERRVWNEPGVQLSSHLQTQDIVN